MNVNFGYSFPAIRGVQAGREYYVSMCPLRLIPRMFIFDEKELPPELRAQRILNKGRIPEITKYLLNNPLNYTFSAITASIDGRIDFIPFANNGDFRDVGALKVSMDAKFIINDGQHRRAAIEIAIREKPEIADETIAVVFFLDIGLERSQQMFSDLNRYAIRPSCSMNVLYDYRDELAVICKRLACTSDVFMGIVEMEKTTLATRSGKLFTLSAIYTASKALMAGRHIKDPCFLKLMHEFWEQVDQHLPEWRMVRERKIPASDVRLNLIHSHSVALHALGRAGNALLNECPQGWKEKLCKIADINWRRDNHEWQGRTIIGGTVSKSMGNVTLTNNLIKRKIGLCLNPEEQRIEDAHLAERIKTKNE